MQVVRFLHKLSGKCLRDMHSRRREAVWVGVGALLRGKRLWLTALGRHVGGGVDEKHSIKRIDRLLGNRHLSGERMDWYRWMARLAVGGCRHPVILVDWSDLDDQKCLFVLRASVAVGGRALPVYEEVHEGLGDRRLHRWFLRRLARVLGPGCRPILVTDAGFRVWWYELVESLGFGYVGRVRNREVLRWSTGGKWFSNKRLHARAGGRPKALGEMWLSKTRPMLTRVYLYKGKAKGRMKRTRMGERCHSGQSNKHASREREPWLLVSNLADGSHAAKRVVRTFRMRMQIEEGFRDLKSPRHGFALRENLGRRLERTANLLLIAALGVLATWLMGLHGYERNLHRGLQANTERRRRVLSVFFVGGRLLVRALKVTVDDLRLAIRILQEDVRSQVPA
ncbi:MAG: IS4 family transposase [Gammaproteobacteria bacterium]|nr:IS4 family transposase [Gammaproteobacteria bacterium]